MHHFAYRNGVMHCEDVSLETIAREVGTPAYVYSDATLRRHYNVLAEAFAGNQALKLAIEGRTPLRRIGDAELDIGSVASFLVSDDASYVNGQAIPVDGGLTASMPYAGKPV